MRFHAKLLAVGIIILLCAPCMAATQDQINAKNKTYSKIISTHPRIFINKYNKKGIRKKNNGILSDAYATLTKRVNHNSIPGRLSNLRDYIYKYAFLYQMTGNRRWADYAYTAMEKVPRSIKVYGGSTNRYAYALEGLSIGFDWCYDKIVEEGKKDYYISLINEYSKGNIENLKKGLPDFHNYASQAEIAMLVAGLATYGENEKAIDYIQHSLKIMEEGEKRDGVLYNVAEAVKYVDGTCNWEGVTYGRQQLFSYVKYCEAWRTATNEAVNPWNGKYSILENAGYYILYNFRPDNVFENIGDVNYRGLSYFDINNLAALQRTFKNEYFTAFINKHYRWKYREFETDVWLGHSRTSFIFYLMWYDPSLKNGNLEDLPMAMKFGDVVIIRQGFDMDDTIISFKSGIHWGFHSQLDHGSFTVYKHAPLAIDSGYYDSWSSGKRHNWNYWKRTIAHNTLLIHNPSDKVLYWPDKNKLVNDGGQRIVFRTFSPPHKLSGYHNKPMSINDLEKNIEEFRMGKINKYESRDDYVFIRTDLTNAYDNKYAGSGTNQDRKAQMVDRQFVYLKSDFIVIFDQVLSRKAKYEKKWLLHSGNYWDKSGKPAVNGNSTIIEGTDEAGIVEFSNSDSIEIVHGEGQLNIKTLLPQKRKVRRVGGAGYEFWVAGKNHTISRKIPKGRQNENPGAWRIEIEPGANEKYTEFLNVIRPAKKGETTEAEIGLMEKPGKNAVGVYINTRSKDSLLLFLKDGKNINDGFEYSNPASFAGRHFVFNAKPNVFYSISQNKSDGERKTVVRLSETRDGVLSSPEGVLFFDSPR